MFKRHNVNITWSLKRYFRSSEINANNYASFPQASADYCVDLVKKHDYENFLCTLLLPSNIRTSAFAVRAFNIEVSKIQDTVSNEQIGLMRMKFWEDAVEKIYTGPVPNQPVAKELYRAAKSHKLSKIYLKRLVSTRAKQLSKSPFPSLETLETYADGSCSAIYYILLEALGIKNVNADHAASHLGKAQGIMNLIRSVPYFAQKGSVNIPQDLLLNHGISHETVLRGKSSEQLQDVFYSIASRANQHVEKARSLSSSVPEPAHVLYLPAVIVDSYLKRLQKFNFDVFNERLQRRNNFLPLQLFWKRFRSQY